jgi:hypothetical protein
MMRCAPFKRLVKTYLFNGERLPQIIDRLKGFDFSCEESDLAYIMEECKSMLPETLAKKFEECQPFNPYTTEIEKQWLEQLGLFEFFDFIMRRKQPDEKPLYFKWFNDCLWILAHGDITCLVNILMFNGDELDSISDVITCKYKKKIGIEALSRYRDIFWDTSSMDAKDTMYFYAPFRKNALIVKNRSPELEAEIQQYDSSNDGLDEQVVFHDSNYIKWKIGYKKINVPTAEDFLEQVRVDSMFKYYEAMNMVRSTEENSESGFNDKIGQYNSERKVRRNVEEYRAKAAKNWFDLFLRANKAKKPESVGDEDIFDRMSKMSMTFDSDKLATVEDLPKMMEDIREDM